MSRWKTLAEKLCCDVTRRMKDAGDLDSFLRGVVMNHVADDGVAGNAERLPPPIRQGAVVRKGSERWGKGGSAAGQWREDSPPRCMPIVPPSPSRAIRPSAYDAIHPALEVPR